MCHCDENEPHCSTRSGLPGTDGKCSAERNSAVTGAEWQLLAVDAATGVERVLAAVDLPFTVASIAGFSLNPDGARFLTSVANMPYDIWMLEGFDQPQ